MTESILTSTKKVLNLDENYTEFDQDVIMHINSVFSILNQIGIGPEFGFRITGADEVWSTFLEDELRLSSIKTYMYLRVRMLFDPPSTSYHITAMEKQIEELEVRLSIFRESYAWTNPNPDTRWLEDDEIILDGGSA